MRISFTFCGLVLTLVLVHGWVVRPVPAQADMNQTNHALADQIIAAYGGTQHITQEGSKAFSGEATLYCSAQFGKRNSHQTRPVTLHWQGPNIRMELVGGERTVALGRNGRGWIQLGDKVFPSEDAGPAMISRQLECLPMFLRRLAGSPANLHPEGYARIGQEWFDVASMSDSKNVPTYVVLDRTSHLIRRMFGTAIPDTAYDDYRMVDGAVAPFKYAQADPLEPTALMPGEKLPGSSMNRTVFRNNRSVERPILAFTGINETESLPETTPPLPTSSVPIVTPITYKQGRLLIAGTINGARAYFAVSNEPFTTVDPAIANATSTVDITLGTASIRLSKPHLKSSSTIFRVPLLDAPAAVLGQDFFRNFSPEFNLPRRSLTLFPNTSVIYTGPDTISTESMLDTDLVTGVTAALPLPVSIDAGAPFSAFPPIYDTVANKHKLPEGVLIPPPVLKEPLSIDGKAIEIGYVRLPVLNYGTVAFKKPMFAVSLTEGETILPKARYFGVLGARNLRDNIIRFDYVNNRIKIFKLAEIEAREFFLSTLDDLQARHFATPESERVLLYENLKRGAHETGNVNVEVLAHILWKCLPTVRRDHEHDPIAVGNSFDEMDLKVQLSRDRVAFGLFKALWCTKGCASFDDHAMVRQLQNAERRAPEQPYILTRLAEAYININQSVTAAQCLTTALKIDPGFEDALRLAEKLAERAADRERTEQIKEARHFYHSIR